MLIIWWRAFIAPHAKEPVNRISIAALCVIVTLKNSSFSLFSQLLRAPLSGLSFAATISNDNPGQVLMVGKSTLRNAMLARRHLLTAAEQESYGRVIQNTFLELDAYARASSIALYLPVNGEVPTAEILDHALHAGKSIYLPVVDHHRIILRQYSQEDTLKPGRFGILEPSAGCLTADPQLIDVFVIPGVVFDLAGNRGGYGKGYYDRLLHFCGKDATLVGICYDFQLVEHMAVELHDVKMDMVITERRVFSSYC